jgi:IS1 family transposase
MGIRDIIAALKVNITKVLKVLKTGKYQIKPRQTYYDCLEIDEFWTYEGKKKNKVWLIYAYHRETGEIVASNRRFAVWGKRDLKTAKKLRKGVNRLGIRYDRVAADNWESFLSAFAENRQKDGKEHIVGTEGNNCLMRRAFRKTCCFSKKLFNHWKAFDIAFFYITMASFEDPSYFVDHHRFCLGTIRGHGTDLCSRRL